MFLCTISYRAISRRPLALLLVGLAVCVAFVIYVVPMFYGTGRWEHYRSGGSFIGGSPSMSPDGSTIVYASPRSGHGDIYRVNRDGSNTLRLTANPDCEADPRYSPDGSKIVFVREEDNVGHVWIMNADGSGQQQLTNDPGDDNTPSFSTDGTQIVFMRYVRRSRFEDHSGRNAEIYTINSDGMGETRLTNNQDSDGPASFSPAGDHLVFGKTVSDMYGNVQDEIWLMDKDGRNATRLGLGSWPSFSPDREHIMFLDDRTADFQYDIYCMDSMGGNVSQITSTGGYKSDPSYCMGGDCVIFLDEPQARGVGMVTIVRLNDRTVEKVANTE